VTESAALITQVAAEIGQTITAHQADQLWRYTQLVLKWNRIANLTGARSGDEFIRRHIADCLTILPWVTGSRVADVGSGAGLPGIVLACVAPKLELQLIEPRGKRARFLEQTRIELGLANATVAETQIEQWRPAAPIDTFICRAFGSLSDFVNATRTVQTPGCRLLAMKGRDPDLEVAALDPEAYRIEVRALTVAGWESRHLVICEPMLISRLV
jgi:16S rRNA (guanine527-N7)-methyltransferase